VFYCVCPKLFSCLWYVQRKPHTYLASILAQSPNRPKQASTWALSPRSTIECVQNDFCGYGTLGKTVHLSSLTLQLSPNRLKRDSTWPTSPRRSIECVQQRFPSVWYVRHKPCTHLALRLALSSNGPKRASTWALSPRSTIGCVQNDFWPYGAFDANNAPILHWY
jgi:hypothetical protein